MGSEMCIRDSLWSDVSGKKIRSFSGHRSPVLGVAFSPDGKLIATASGDKTVKIWGLNSKNALQTFKGHTDHVTSVAFSPDGKRVVSGSRDQTIRVWDLISAKAVLEKRDEFKANRSEQWTQLFNGRDLAGWSNRSTAKWVVNNSVIHGTGVGKSVVGGLVASQEVDNFKLRVRAIAGSGKILFRARSTRRGIEGYYLSLETDPGARAGTVGTVGRFRPFHGSTRLVDPPKTDVVPGKVVDIELTVIGNEFTIKVDDSIPAKGHDRDKTYAHGSLVLWCGKKTKIAVGQLSLHHIEAGQYDEPK